jgi:hypothetical protein
MPRKIVPKPCACGCGGITKGGKFIPGHDTRVYRAILQHIDGDVLDLKRIIEQTTDRTVVVEQD